MVIPDSITSYLLCATDAATILPGVFICLFPIRKWARIPVKYMFSAAFAASVIFSLIVPFFGYGTTVNGNFFVLPFLAIAFIIYLALVQLSKPKLIYLFLCTTASFSYGGLVNYLVTDYLHYEDASSVHWEGVLVQWIIEILLLLFFLWIRPRLTWLLENFDEPYTWVAFCFLPAVITVLNIMMIPQNPEIMRQGRMFQISLIIEGVLLVFFLMYQLVFYEIAQVFRERYEREKMSQLLDEQVMQYQSLQTYIDQTDRLMHDMRQVIRTIRQLAKDGKLDELDKLAQEYEATSLAVSTPDIFCEHIPLNAMLVYYAGLSKQQHIDINWEIEVPAEIPVSDVEICTLFGNLLENAFNACQDVPEEKRYIHLSADTKTPGCLYIVMVNSRSTETAKKKHPTKHHGNGIGTSSIKATAEKYGGTAEFLTKENEFHSYVMLSI